MGLAYWQYTPLFQISVELSRHAAGLRNRFLAIRKRSRFESDRQIPAGQL